MLALTGQQSEAEARWQEPDSKRVWTIPPERLKMDAPHVLLLADDVLAILESLPRFKSDTSSRPCLERSR
jgi:hypothetical protein